LKKILRIAAALTALAFAVAATPSLAKTSAPQPMRSWQQFDEYGPPEQVGPTTVVVDGGIIGQDPDPAIRSSLSRDHGG
jgi:hypothetical protein